LGVIFYLHASQIILMEKKRPQQFKTYTIQQLNKPFLLLYIKQEGSGTIPMRVIF
jgi:hypothetical protein